MLEKENSPKSETSAKNSIEQALEGIDFNVLRNIFYKLHTECYKKNTLPDMGFAPSNSIEILGPENFEDGVIASYSKSPLYIAVNADSIMKHAAESGIPIEYWMLLILAHEEGHAASTNKQQNVKRICSYGTGLYHTQRSSLGLKGTLNDKHGNHIEEYNLLEEGVRDLLAIRVARTYIEQTEGNSDMLERLISYIDSHFFGYYEERDLIRSMMSRIAQDLNFSVPEDIALDSLFRASHRGDDLYTWMYDSSAKRGVISIESWWDSIFGAGFSQDLKALRSGDVHNFILKYNLSQIDS